MDEVCKMKGHCLKSEIHSFQVLSNQAVLFGCSSHNSYHEDIQSILVLNGGLAGIKIVPSTSWMMEKRGLKNVDMLAVNQKRGGVGRKAT